MDEEKFVPIDIKTLACRVKPALGKLIPKFMYRHFEKLLHVHELNVFIEEHFHDDAQTFLDAVVAFLNFNIQLGGRGTDALEELKGQNVMFASNHPFGGPEAMMLMDILYKYFPDTKLLTQGFLKFIKPLQTCCVYNKKEVRTLMEAVNLKKSLLFYPAGYCSRELSFKEVYDYEWKSSFVKIAKKNNMPILVFYTDGQLSKRMHRWTKFRRIFRIKASIETMYLVDEMFMLRDKTIDIVVGDTIYPDQLSDDISNEEWAARIRQYCHDLRKDPNAHFDYSKPATLPLK